MKKIILLCALSIVFLLNADAQNKSITFRETGSFSEVLAEAAKSKKLIFLDAYTSWCVPCKVLAKEVLRLIALPISLMQILSMCIMTWKKERGSP
jgi:thiol:disulfide interchange protein